MQPSISSSSRIDDRQETPRVAITKVVTRVRVQVVIRVEGACVARASSVNLRLGVAGEPLIAREIYDFRQLRGRFAYRAPSRKPSCTRERSASSHHRRFDRLVLRTCSSCSSRRSPLESTVDFADLLPTRYSGELIELSRRERSE